MEPALRITSQLVREQEPSLLAVARRAVRRNEDAEDLVQEMWMSALGSASSFEGRSSARTWLTAILRRRIADRFRRQQPSAAYDEEQYASEDGGTLERLAQRQLAELALGSLSALGELERQALELCALADLDRDQACERLGITRGHLRVLLHRARRKLADDSAPAR